MSLSSDDIEKMCDAIVEQMSLSDLIQYVYEDLLYLNLKDYDVAKENWFSIYGVYPE